MQSQCACRSLPPPTTRSFTDATLPPPPSHFACPSHPTPPSTALFLSALWLLHALVPARRPAAPRWAVTKCWATSAVIWELIWDAILAAFWLAITIAAGNMGIMTMEGACAVLAAVLFVLLCLSWAGTFCLAKMTAGPAPPADAPPAAAEGAAGDKKKGKKGEEEKKEGDVEAPKVVEEAKKPSAAAPEEGSGVTGKVEVVSAEGVKVEEKATSK